MATTLYLLDSVADTHLGANNLNLLSSAVGWTAKALGTARGSGVVASDAMATVTGATAGVTVRKGSTAVEWISPPVAADVTISGTVTLNLWSSETNMSANVAINARIFVIRANATATQNSNTLDTIATTARVIEVAVTTRAANNFTVTPTSTVVNRGDRLRVILFGDDVGTMATGYTFDASWNGTGAAADGDSYVTFTEDFTFESAPAGSVLYLTNTASAVATANIDNEAWTTSGTASTANGGVAHVTGWTAPIQLKNFVGGTNLDFFTRPLTAFTLGGMAVAKIFANVSFAGVVGSLRCEIARVEGDGTSPTVWASWCIAPTGTDNGGLTSTTAQRTAYVSGDDLAISNGQRLRIRFYADDTSNAAMTNTGRSTSITYNYSVVPGGNGDSYITFQQTLTEFSSAPGPSQSYRFLRANRFLTSR